MRHNGKKNVRSVLLLLITLLGLHFACCLYRKRSRLPKSYMSFLKTSLLSKVFLRNVKVVRVTKVSEGQGQVSVIPRKGRFKKMTFCPLRFQTKLNISLYLLEHIADLLYYWPSSAQFQRGLR